MIIKLCEKKNIPLINIVRRDEQVKLLKEDYGCKYVLNSSDDKFFEEFRNLAKELKATTLIECIGGPITSKLMECLPSKSQVALYGDLSEKPLSDIDPLLMIGRSYTIKSFILGTYLASKGLSIIFTMGEVSKLMADKTLQANIHKRFKISEFKDSVAEYYKNMTAGKMILCPHEIDENL